MYNQAYIIKIKIFFNFIFLSLKIIKIFKYLIFIINKIDKTKVIFNFNGIDIEIQCSTEDKVKDICQKFTEKIKKDINLLAFIHGGNNVNYQLSFKEQANSIDKERKGMGILVFNDELDSFSCPKCGEKIKLDTEKIDEIISSINNIKDYLNEAKLLLDNIINNSQIDSILMQLKSVNSIITSSDEQLQKKQ